MIRVPMNVLLRYAAYALIGEAAATAFFLTSSEDLVMSVVLATVTVALTAAAAALLRRRWLVGVRILIGLVVAWLVPVLVDLVTAGGVYNVSDLRAVLPILLVLVGIDWRLRRHARTH